MEESLIRKLMSSIKCTVCGKYYEADYVDVLGHQEDLWFMKALCPACNSEFVVAALLQESDDLEITTDLNGAELIKFESRGDLIADDVLDMHDFLSDFNGDFSHLFGQDKS